MSKYIIDTDDFEPMFKVDSIGVFGIGKSVTDNTEDHSWSRIRTIEEFEELNSDYINEHFGDLQDTAYQRGLEEGKAVNDNGCEGCKYQANRELTCPCSECANNFKNQWTAKDDKIEVGDEVADKDGDKTIVTNIHGDLFDGLCSDGSTMTDLFLDDNRKTGRHFNIKSILEEMRND
jgi:hypothetical protein